MKTEGHNKHFDEVLQALEDEKQTERQRYERRMQELEEEIARVKLERARAHNAQLPIILLPEEISLAIFRYSARIWYTEKNSVATSNIWNDDDSHDGSAISSYVEDSKSPPEIVISYVCHAWRSLTLDSPEMWSAFTCDAYRGIFQGNLAKDSVTWLSAYLERSQSYPLDLALWPDIGKPDDHFTSAINLLPPHTHRLRQFSLCLTRTNHMAALRSMEPIHADNLEKLEIVREASYYNLPRRRRRETLSQDNLPSSVYKNAWAPKLSALRVACDLLVLCLPTTSSITVLQIDNSKKLYTMPWPTFVSIFEIPTLVSLSVSQLVVEYPSELEVITQPIVANNLRHFRCADIGVLGCVLTTLIAPYLELMNLSRINFDIGWDNRLQFLFDEHGARLFSSKILDYLPEMKILSFNHCTYSNANLIWRVLAHATRTTTQILVASSHPYWQPNTLVDDNNSALWPNLTTLSHSIKCSTNNLGMTGSSVATGIGLLKLLKRQAKYAKTQGYSHHIEEGYLQDLKNELGQDVWETLEKDGILRDVVPINTQNIKFWIPWPPRQEADFHNSSESLFGSNQVSSQVPYLPPPSNWDHNGHNFVWNDSDSN